MESEMKSNHERYPVQSHGGSTVADLEYATDGWPILTATKDEPAQGISREFRWAYGPEQRVWVIHTNGDTILYEGISQCWLDENDRVYRMVSRPVPLPVRSEWLDL